MTEYFIWDVNRTILGTGLISLRWYSLLFMTGVGTAYIWVTHMAKAENIGLEGLEDLFFYVLITTIAGARLGHCLFYDPVYYLSNPLQILKIWQGGWPATGDIWEWSWVFSSSGGKTKPFPFSGSWTGWPWPDSLPGLSFGWAISLIQKSWVSQQQFPGLLFSNRWMKFPGTRSSSMKPLGIWQ